MPTVKEVLDSGWSAHQQGDLAQAERCYRAVLDSLPDNANAWCFLGMLEFDRGNLEASNGCYEKAIQSQPRFTIALSNRTNTLLALGREDEAVESAIAAIELDPSYANAHLNLGAAYSRSARWLDAEQSFERVLELTPTEPSNGKLRTDARRNLGMLRLLQGRYEEGWSDYEARLLSDDSMPEFAMPRWAGDSLEGRAILVWAEQGFGDTIQFVRFVKCLASEARQVHVATPDELLALFAQSTWPNEVRFHSKHGPLPSADVWCPMMSLPSTMGHKEEEFSSEPAYLQVDSARIAFWRDRLGESIGPRMAVVWQGNPDHPDDSVRSIPLAAFHPLSRLADVELLSLQQGYGAKQTNEVEFSLKTFGNDFDHDRFVDSAAVCLLADCLVTVDTSMAHLAGALGVPVCLLLSFSADWRWLLDRNSSPWYPSVRIVRQCKGKSWTNVFERLHLELKAMGIV